MAALVYREPNQLRLRKTDLFDKLLNDEEATLDEESIYDGDLLWLEEGKVVELFHHHHHHYYYDEKGSASL